MLSRASYSLDPLIKNFILEIAGRNGLRIVANIGDGATDERIEKHTKMKIAEIRAILNHLHSYGVVEYTREKNLENGWFTYTWKLNLDRVMQNFLTTKRKEYLRLRSEVEENASMSYACKRGCVRLGFEEAMEQRFSCPKCKKMLIQVDNQTQLQELEEKISAIERVIGRAT
jgi:transcription factor E